MHNNYNYDHTYVHNVESLNSLDSMFLLDYIALGVQL